MLWEKKTKTTKGRGYLYIRETIYKRDRRTIKRTPKNKGNGVGLKNRGKFSIKRDIYCGRIVEIQVKHLISFQEYIKQDFLEYKLKITFDEMLNDFVNYLLYIYEIPFEDYNSGKKLAYEIGSGFLCEQTIDYIRKFKTKQDFDSNKEIERFANRCLDAGIYDNEVIMTLYIKLAENQKPKIVAQNKELYKKIEEENYSDFEDFMRKRR